MHQIYIMAAVTTVVAVVSVGGFLRWRSPREEWLLLVAVGMMTLPMCALAFYFVRMPLLDGLVRHFVDTKSTLYGVLSTWYAPLTEEPAKIWPLIFLGIRRRITRENFWRVAMALGLGFGVGELWFIAHQVTLVPAYDALKWYQFMGFLNERFMVCIIHGTFVVLTLFVFSRRRSLLGLPLAMLAHFCLNFPLYLAAINVPPLGVMFWGIFLQLYLPVGLLAGIVWTVILSTGTTHVAHFMFGNSICPGCGAEYPSPLMGVNLFNKRFERCPRCRKWHLVSRFKKWDGGTPV